MKKESLEKYVYLFFLPPPISLFPSTIFQPRVMELIDVDFSRLRYGKRAKIC